MVLVEDVSPVAFHVDGFGIDEAFDSAAFEHVEHSELWLEGGVEEDDVLSGGGDELDDASCFLVEDVVVDEVDFGSDSEDEGVGFDHESVEDVVEQQVAAGHGLDGVFVVFEEVFFYFVEEFVDDPVGLAEGDDVVFAPEDFDFAYAHEFVAFVEIGELEDEEVVVVVFVDLWALVGAFAVFDVQGVEMVGVLQIFIVVLAWIGNVLPF